MSSFLLTWNPDRFDSWDDLSWMLQHRRSQWSCGSRKTLPKGSRVYLLRQGSEPRGIVASGVTTRDVYSDTHWDPARRKKRQRANYIDVGFDVVLGPDPAAFLPVARLKTGKLRSVNWRTQMSGIQIHPEAAAELERVWAQFNRSERRRFFERPIKALENTLTEVKRYVRKRDRALRERAIVEARGICEACDVYFGDILNGIGLRALQVHHRRQLAASDHPRINGLSDLAVVCANCHAMIHADSQRAMPVEKLRRRLKRAAA
jgi:5-methylcytosine-specific restriction protein A